MAYVVGVKYGQSANDSWDPKDNSVKGSVSGVYIIRTDDEPDPCAITPDYILRNVSGIPRLGSALPWAPSLYLVNRTTTEVTDSTWEVECEYEYFRKERDKPEPDEPWNVKPKWSWSSSTFDDVLFKSYDDAGGIGQEGPIVNSAGTKYPPIVRPENSPVLSLTIPRLNFDYKKEMDYVNTVNTSNFWGWGKYQALMQDISAQQAEQEGIEYWNVTYKIAFKSLKVTLTHGGSETEVGWRTVLLDEGPEYKVLVPLVGNIVQKFKTAEGDAYVGNLDGSGGQAPDGEFYWNVFNQYELKDFNALGNMGPY